MKTRYQFTSLKTIPPNFPWQIKPRPTLVEEDVQYELSLQAESDSSDD